MRGSTTSREAKQAWGPQLFDGTCRDWAISSALFVVQIVHSAGESDQRAQNGRMAGRRSDGHSWWKDMSLAMGSTNLHGL